MTDYWHAVLSRRIGRRRALAGSLAAGSAGAFLMACGGDGSGLPPAPGPNDPGPTDSSGLLYVREDETLIARLGGTYTGSHPNVLTTYDPMRPGAHVRIARRGYSQLFRIADGVLQMPDGEVEGDLAASWEMSPDNLTLTVRLFPEAGFPPVPPLQGRHIDADDVTFTWERFRESGHLRNELANEANPAAPITSIETVDSGTVVIHLARPDAIIYALLGSDVLGGMYVLPREAADPSKVDIPRQAMGTGPYYLVEGSEQGYRWRKNPHFKRLNLLSGEPFIDEIYEPVITDPAVGAAQFLAGTLLEYPLAPDEVLAVKEENPLLRMRTTPPIASERIFFGSHPNSPFRDDRLRIALMKSIDRDAFIAAAYSTEAFESTGLPIQDYWEGGLSSDSYAGWYLDPRDEESFPETAANYVFDLAEARQLILAAGHDTPLAFDNTYGAPDRSSFPLTRYARAELFMEMIDRAGLWRQSRVPVDYRTQWSTEKFRFSGGQFNGLSWGPDTAPREATQALFSVFNSRGGYYMGGDETLDHLTGQARMAFDPLVRMELIHAIQRHNSAHMFNEKIGVAGGFTLGWPALRNVNVYQGGTNWLDIATPSSLRAWLAPDSPPFA